MKDTLKTLYDIDVDLISKYDEKVYKIKSKDKNYCLKYSNYCSNNELINKLEALNLSSSFVLPIKNNIRTRQITQKDKSFYIREWIDEDDISSKDLKVKYYLNKLGEIHKKSSYSLNVTISFYKEIALQIEERIQECFQKYENIMYIIERKEYKSPFEWYFIFYFKDVVDSLDKSRTHLENFRKQIKDKVSIRQVITHQNFAYDHIFITKDKIIGNNKMKLASPVYDLKSLFDKIEYGNIDIVLMLDEYLKINQLYDYEISWLLSLLFIVDDLNLSNNDKENLNKFMKILFKVKSINEIENIIKK